MIKFYQSKWGYHPCNIETYRKLQFLNKLTYKAVSQFSAWERWHKKDRKNRVVRQRVRDDQGRVVGYKLVGESAEPKVMDILAEKVQYYRDERQPGTFCEHCGYTVSPVVRKTYYSYKLCMDLIARIRQSKRAAQTPTQGGVEPMSLSVEEIDKLYEKAKLQ